MLKIPVYLQILFDVNLNFIEQFDFLEIFCYFGGINLSEKCVNVSCCIVFDCGQNEPDQPEEKFATARNSRQVS